MRNSLYERDKIKLRYVYTGIQVGCTSIEGVHVLVFKHESLIMNLQHRYPGGREPLSE